MAVDKNGIISSWATLRGEGTKMAELAMRSNKAYVKDDGTEAKPHADTITGIETEIALVVPKLEAAVAALKTAYTP